MKGEAMPKKKVEKPVPGPEAFRKTSEAAVQSQAAILLMLGRQIRGDDQTLVARAAAAGRPVAVEAVAPEDLSEFPIPALRPTGERVGLRRVSTGLAERFGRTFTAAAIGTVDEKALRRPLS